MFRCSRCKEAEDSQERNILHRPTSSKWDTTKKGHIGVEVVDLYVDLVLILLFVYQEVLFVLNLPN